MFRSTLALALTGLLNCAPVQAQIIAAPDAARDQQPVILKTANGLPQVELTEPTAAGVSRNRFRQFDIESGGAILNNGRKDSRTELGGWVAANPNMAGGTARVILNEVQSSDPSQLHGYLEIAGDKAELVLANPAGITCRGCGFIQASRVQLITGTPQFHGAEVGGFYPGTGALRIEGQGLDGRRVDSVSLLSQAIELNAGLWANDLDVRLAAPRTASSAGSAPTFALDVSALGGMYAGKIWLVGSAHGLGVRNNGAIAAQGKLTLSIDGKLENTGRIDASQIVLRADTVDNLATGSITGEQVAIGTRRLSNAGHPEAAPLIAAAEQLDIGATEILNTDKALIFSAGAMQLGGALDAGHRAVGAAEVLTNADATIESLGHLTIRADQINNLNRGVRTEERQIGETSTESYLQPQGSSEKIPLSQFRWESWSRAGRYRWLTDPDALSTGILGKTPIPGVGEEHCVDAGGVETCSLVAGASYPRDDPAWTYFGLTPPDEAPPPAGTAPVPPSLLLPPAPEGTVDTQSAEYQSWLLKKTAYDQAWADYEQAKNIHEQRVSALNDWTADTDTRREALDQAIENYNAGFSGSHITAWTQYIDLRRAEFETVVTETRPGKIIAGGDLTLSGQQLVNDRSQLLAGGQLRGDLDKLQNIDTPGTHRLEESGTSQHTRSRWRGGFKRYHQRDWGPVLPYQPADVVTSTPLGTYQAEGESLTITTHSLQTQAESLLTLNEALADLNPGHGPLLVTDPRFTQYRTWLSSDVMLAQLSHDPATMQKRIGDGFIEQKLVREQVADLTGRRFLQGYTSDELQYAALMESGLRHADRLALRPGIELTGEQVAQLTSDLVWLVEESITIPARDGQPARSERVLVPRVYLLPREGDLHTDGSLISAERIDLAVNDAMYNAGLMIGRHSVQLDTGSVENDGGDIRGGRVAVSAAQDVRSQGGSLRADGDLIIVAGRDVQWQSTTRDTERSSQNHRTRSEASRTHLDRQASLQVSGDGHLIVVAGRDITLDGAQITHSGQGQTMLIAERDLQLGTVDTRYDTASQSVHNSANFQRESGHHEVGTRIEARNDIHLVGGGDISTRAATIRSDDGQARLIAGGDLKLAAGESGREFAQGSQYKHSGVTGSKTITQRFGEERRDAIETLVSGDRVSLQAGGDIQIEGGIVVADRDVRLIAGNDIDIHAAAGSERITSYEHRRQSGVFSGPGASVTVGTQQTTQTQEFNSTTQQASLIGSLQGDVHILAGGQYRQEASQLIATSGSVQVEAAQIDVVAVTNTQEASSSTVFRQSGVTVSVSNPIVSGAQTLDQLNEARKNTTDARAQHLAAASAALTVTNTVNDIQQDPARATGITVSVTAGSSKSESRSEQQIRVAAPSVIAAANDVHVIAPGDEDAGIRVTGSQISAGQQLHLHSDGSIDLNAQANTATHTSTNKSSSNAIGVSASVDQSGMRMGVAVSASRGRGNADGDDLSWTSTHLQAGQQVVMDAQDDIHLRGAIVTADQVTVRTDGDLQIESLQDLSRYSSRQSQTGVDGVIPLAGTPSAQMNIGNQHVDSIYQSVNETAGIRAGDGGFDITVAGNTVLKGAVITSTDSAHDTAKNQFSSNTLSTSDLDNHASYSASATTITLGVAQHTSGNFTPSNSSAGHANDRDQVNSVTRAGITGLAGDTEIRTGDADAPLPRIFDAGRVEREISANAQVIQLFGLQASKAIGDYADSQLKRADALRAQAAATGLPDIRRSLEAEAESLENLWGDHGSARVLAHTAVGALTGGIDGAFGAAAGTLTAAHLGDALRNAGIDGALADTLTAMAATTAGALTGNVPGAVAAFNEVSNNYLSHAEARRYAELREKQMLGRCDAACQSEISTLDRTDKQRDQELRTCHGVQTPACDAIRQQVRITAAEFIRNDSPTFLSLDYEGHRLKTTSLAEDTMGGTRLARAAGFAEALAEGITDLAKGAWIGLKAIAGDSAAREQVEKAANASFEFLSDVSNLKYLFGALTPQDRERLATAYEQGDAQTIGRIYGEQLASMPMGSGGFGTVKGVGKAGNLTQKSPTHPDHVEHIIGGDFNTRSQKVTGGHSLLNGDVRIVEMVSPPDANGVYRAVVEIRQPDGQWTTKSNKGGSNTMFPADWSREKIIEEVDSAWKNRKAHSNEDKWIGTSNSGIEIEGYKYPNPTAFPVYKKGDKN